MSPDGTANVNPKEPASACHGPASTDAGPPRQGPSMPQMRALAAVLLCVWFAPGCDGPPRLFPASLVLRYNPGPATVTLSPPAPCPPALSPPNPQRMHRDVVMLAEQIGPRPAGSAAEGHAREYIARELRASGWDVSVQGPIPVGDSHLRTTNLIACAAPRPDRWLVILGAHYDSLGRARSPGANDNASGVAVLLEVARTVDVRSLPFELRLVFFGAEEVTPDAPEHHHVGSEFYVNACSEAERSGIAAMLSVDMVGAGGTLCASRLGFGSDRARQALLAAGDRLGLRLNTDTGRPWSDHVPFERSGVPAVWLTRFGDTHWHTPNDRAVYVTEAALNETAKLVRRFLLELAEDQRQLPVGLPPEDGRPRAAPVGDAVPVPGRACGTSAYSPASLQREGIEIGSAQGPRRGSRTEPQGSEPQCAGRPLVSCWYASPSVR